MSEEFDKYANTYDEVLAVRAGLRIVDSAYTLFFPKQLAFLRGLEPALRRQSGDAILC